MKRGVVFTPSEILRVEPGKGFRVGNAISEEHLNYLVLYWDKLVSPTNNIINIGVQNEKQLVECGVLTRPKFEYRDFSKPLDLAEIQTNSHIEALRTLRKEQGDVDWRMHFLNDQVSLHQESSEEKDVLRFELVDLLPVPQKEVPLCEILEFKERRTDELLALHAYLDELYTEVLSSGDFYLQRAKALSGLKQALRDLNELNNQGWRSPIKFDLSSSFEFDLRQIYAGATTALAAMASPHPFATVGVGTVVTALSGFIKVKPQIQSVLKNGDHNLAYLTNARKEGIVKEE
ncbi:DUF6236 family protein [Escherichia coli]|uniref:DUF6236 family protein n=1 Tax=Escherichia coli TaxID=562 RepID=UPI0039C94BE3